MKVAILMAYTEAKGSPALAGAYLGVLVVVMILLVKLTDTSSSPPAEVTITYRAMGTTSGPQLILLFEGSTAFTGEEALTPELAEGIAKEVPEGETVKVEVTAPWVVGQPGTWGCEIRGSDGEVLDRAEVHSPSGRTVRSATCEATAR